MPICKESFEARKVKQLIVIQFKNSRIYEKVSQKHFAVTALALLAGVAFILRTLLGTQLQRFYQEVATLGLESRVLDLLIASLLGQLLVLGLFHVLSSFYFSKDIAFYLPLPIRPRELLLSHLFYVWVGQWLIFLLGIGTFMGFYGAQHFPAAGFYLNGLLASALLPVVPLVVLSLFAFLVMRAINLSRYKRLLQFVLYAFLAATPFLVRQAFRAVLASAEVPRRSLLVRFLDRLFFHYANPIDLLLLVLAAAVSLTVFAAVGEKLYYRGVRGGLSSSEAAGGRRQRARGVRTHRSETAYLLSECRAIARNPVFLIQCLVKNALWPVLVLAVLWWSKSELLHVLPNLTVLKSRWDGSLLLFVAGVIYLQVGQNYSAAVSISKDGGQVAFFKQIPMAYGKQIWLRALSCAILLDAPALVLLTAILWLAGPAWQVWLLSYLLLGLMGMLGALLGVLVDLGNPYLDWNSEAALVKHNLNIFLVSLAAIGVAGGLFFLAFRYALSIPAAAGIGIGFPAAGLLALAWLVQAKGEAWFKRILPSS
ncbi:hypothetical protein [Gorillibacterium sp. sgz500922]|uniref:hypothetical protein n=1 Tax=Gorillibacterium sp. sgz500922 TaxID=3446694 RepID=UPI003F6704BD